MENLDYANYVITSITEVNFFEKKPELRQLRQLRITEAIFLKKNLNYVNYVITPITQLQKRQNHPLVLPLVKFGTNASGTILWTILQLLCKLHHLVIKSGTNANY